MKRIEVDPSRGFGLEISAVALDEYPPLELFTEAVLEKTAQTFREQRELTQHHLLVIQSPAPGLLRIVPTMNKDEVDDTGWIGPAIARCAAKLKARALYVVSEAWIVEYAQTGDEKDDVKNAREIRASTHPERIEVVMVQEENPAHTPPMRLWLAKVLRNQGRPKLGAWEPRFEEGKIHPVEGRMVYLLPPEAYGRVGSA